MKSFDKKWKAHAEELRTILLELGLEEETKWAKPCFLFEGANIAIIQDFKDKCALMYFKGALLKDPKGLLNAPGENSQSARRLEFTTQEEIIKARATIRAFTKQAIEVEKKGLTVVTKKDLDLPEELKKRFLKDKALKKAFEGLTPGRQRAYCLFISAAKQSQTREARIDKFVTRILAGKGMHD